MKKLFYILLGAALLFALPSCLDKKKAKNYNNQTSVDQGGLSFIKEGLDGSITEVRAAKVAITNSTNTRVTGFANMMIADHTKAADELKKIGIDRYVTADNIINPGHKQMIADLAAKKGDEFDKAYMEMMVEDHKEAIRLFEEGGENTSVAIHNFAEKTLPILKMHLDSAKAINASLK